MKQIVPFKKELPFKTKVSDITSISLERDIEVLKDGIVTGSFHISGDYKMNEGSINREKFSFDLPFDITLDPRYDVSTVNADIEDFYYDVVNEDTLKVNIDLFIEAEYLPVTETDESLLEESEDCDKEQLEEVRKADTGEESLDIIGENENININNNVNDSTNNDIDSNVNVSNDTDNLLEDLIEEAPAKNNVEDLDITKEFIPSIDFAKNEKEELPVQREVTASDLFSNLDDTETYTTYYVYIVKEEDTIDKIMMKYEVTKESLEDYNDISSIKPGDKIIIPKKNE